MAVDKSKPRFWEEKVKVKRKTQEKQIFWDTIGSTHMQ